MADNSKLAQLTEDLEIRQGVRNFVNTLRRLDQSIARAEGEPSRVERLREAVLKKINGKGDIIHERKAEDDDGNVSGTLSLRLPTAQFERLSGMRLYAEHPGDKDALVEIGRIA